MKERSYEEVKAKYVEFVQSFLSEEPGTERTELLPNLWVVVNKKHNFKVIIECRKLGSSNPRTGYVDWFAVVDHEGEKRHFLLEFEEDSI